MVPRQFQYGAEQFREPGDLPQRVMQPVALCRGQCGQAEFATGVELLQALLPMLAGEPFEPYGIGRLQPLGASLRDGPFLKQEDELSRRQPLAITPMASASSRLMKAWVSESSRY